MAEKLAANHKQLSMNALEAYKTDSNKIRSIRHTLQSMGNLQSTESLSYSSLRNFGVMSHAPMSPILFNDFYAPPRV